MLASLPLLFLFIGSTSGKKQGDFGVFTACVTKNDSLRLACYYANCSGSPSFECEFTTSSGLLLARASDSMCSHVIPNHRSLHANESTTYNCTLTRRKRVEKRSIIVDYKIKGRKRIKNCRGTSGLLLHRTPTSVWPVAILSLLRVLVTDRQTT